MVDEVNTAAPREGHAVSDLTRTGTLLQEVFGLPGLGRTDYLQWLYHDSPEGKAVQVNLDDEKGLRLAHYAIVPQTYHHQGQRRRLALSLNTAVAEPARGRGVFSRLGEETYQKGWAREGLGGVVGVANSNSTPGFVGRLKFRLLGPLPVRVGIIPPLSSKAVISRPVTSEWLAGDEAKAILSRADLSPDRLWSQHWTPAKISWRLARPRGRYWVHHDQTGLMVTRVEPFHGLKVVVVLKIWPLKNCPLVRTGRLLRVACAAHGTPFFLYAGFNARARVRGLPVPRRLLPQPLNLIYRQINPQAPAQDEFRLSVFEFLDFDAY